MLTSAIDRAFGSPDYVIEIVMPLFSKARPRMTKSGHVFMPQAYKDAQAEMRRQMRLQWPGEPLEGPIAVRVIMFGEGRLDADNGAGAVLDCGNDLIWKDDRVSIISTLAVEWHKAPKKDSRWLIHITLLDGPLQ